MTPHAPSADSRLSDVGPTHVAVVVPAADEQDRIAACLGALDRARAHLRETSGGTVDSSVVVVLDGCTDRTARIASRFDALLVTSTARCVGAARRLGSARALAHSPASPERVWLANTDADSRVPVDWLTGMVDLAAEGVELALGTVVPGDGLPARVAMAWHARHEFSDGHRHVHGANLGIRADAYLRIGGWSPLASGEDVDLAARAVAAGLTVSRTGHRPVVTSARITGRAPHGFSSYLRDLAAVNRVVTGS